MEIELIFSEQIFDGICKDIEYYLEKAKRDIRAQIWIGRRRLGRHPRGQVLAALGLMVYTEYLGRFVPDHEKKKNKDGKYPDRQQFDAFFRRLGGGYKEFLYQYDDVDGKCLYYHFRCKLVHEYFAKEEWTIAIPNNKRKFTVRGNPDVEVQRPVKVGIGKAENGSYYLVLERYYEDFKRAAKVLLDERLNEVSKSSPFVGQSRVLWTPSAETPSDTG